MVKNPGYSNLMAQDLNRQSNFDKVDISTEIVFVRLQNI